MLFQQQKGGRSKDGTQTDAHGLLKAAARIERLRGERDVGRCFIGLQRAAESTGGKALQPAADRLTHILGRELIPERLAIAELALLFVQLLQRHISERFFQAGWRPLRSERALHLDPLHGDTRALKLCGTHVVDTLPFLVAAHVVAVHHEVL